MIAEPPLDLALLFANLERPSAVSSELLTLRARVVPGWPRYRVGRDGADRPCILIETNTSDVTASGATELENFSYIPCARCMLTSADGNVVASLAVVRCRSEDRELQAWFMQIMDAWLDGLGRAPTQADLDRAVDQLVSLFLSLGRAASGSVQGLWGELYLIAHARNPQLLITAWHSDPMELHDFCATGDRLEVKTVQGSLREHRFSLAQLLPIDGARLMIGSLLLRAAPGGLSVEDLVASIRGRVREPDLVVRVQEIIARTLGENWKQASALRFSLARTDGSIAFIPGELIPRVSGDFDASISDVNFNVDLAALARATAATLAGSALWAAVDQGGAVPVDASEAEVPEGSD